MMPIDHDEEYYATLEEAGITPEQMGQRMVELMSTDALVRHRAALLADQQHLPPQAITPDSKRFMRQLNAEIERRTRLQ